MQISAQEEYGLRCALQLARGFGRGPLSASKIAHFEGISVEYVSKFMHLFRKSGLVKGLRGTQGGFCLQHDPKEVTLKEVLDSVRGRKNQSTAHFCTQFTGQLAECVHIDECSARPVWLLIASYFESLLKQLTLNDLLSHENEVRRKVESHLSESVQAIKAVAGKG